jgi:hypothetical protein
MTLDNRVAVLALIASDDSYRSSWQPGDFLQTYPDSEAVYGVSEPDPIPEQLILSADLDYLEIAEGEFLIHEWKVVGVEGT